MTMKKIILLAATFLLLIGILTAFSLKEYKNNRKASLASAEAKKKPEEENKGSIQPVKEPASPPKPVISTVTLAAVGDILIHDRVYYKARQPDGTYNFNPMFRFVKPYLAKSDITIANQETMIGGKLLGLSSYPSFNSPYEIGDALKDNGVDLVTLANNHTLDRGEKVIQSAIRHWNKIGMPYTGSFQSKKDQDRIRILKKNGIFFSFLSYTYGTNGITVPREKSYLVNLIDLKQIQQDIRAAKQLSDVVVVSLHFGLEYERMPNKEQKRIVQETANSGADIIIGSHPHVLQPVAWVKRKDGQRTFVAYSLGNFLSGQRWDYKDIGGIVRIEVKKTVIGNKEKIKLQHPAFLPTWVNRNYEILPIKQLKDKKSTYEEIKKHMNQWTPELSFQF